MGAAQSQSNRNSKKKLSAQRVEYDTDNHFWVLFQMKGSVWPKVLHHCLLNLLNVGFVVNVNKDYDINLGFSDKGHTFMSLIVSFLIVTRSNITYARFMEARAGLSSLMRACRELIQYAVTFTRFVEIPDAVEKSLEKIVDEDERIAAQKTAEEAAEAAAAEWRYELVKRTMALLSTVVTVLQYPSKDPRKIWEGDTVLHPDEKNRLLEMAGDQHIRIPMVVALFVRTTIASIESSKERKFKKIHVNKQLRLYGLVNDFVSSYHVLTRLVDTQFPFPLAQMNKTFVFIWVYSLPWVLYHDDVRTMYLCFIVTFITFAFVGLEYISIELDDPFGEDPNDFDVKRLADAVCNDIRMCIADIDGKERADRLLKYMREPKGSTSTPTVLPPLPGTPTSLELEEEEKEEDVGLSDRSQVFTPDAGSPTKLVQFKMALTPDLSTELNHQVQNETVEKGTRSSDTNNSANYGSLDVDEEQAFFCSHNVKKL